MLLASKKPSHIDGGAQKKLPFLADLLLDGFTACLEVQQGQDRRCL